MPTVPLPERLRPQTLSDVVGQNELVGSKGLFGLSLMPDTCLLCFYGGHPALAKRLSLAYWPLNLAGILLLLARYWVACRNYVHC